MENITQRIFKITATAFKSSHIRQYGHLFIHTLFIAFFCSCGSSSSKTKNPVTNTGDTVQVIGIDSCIINHLLWNRMIDSAENNNETYIDSIENLMNTCDRINVPIEDCFCRFNELMDRQLDSLGLIRLIINSSFTTENKIYYLNKFSPLVRIDAGQSEMIHSVIGELAFSSPCSFKAALLRIDSTDLYYSLRFEWSKSKLDSFNLMIDSISCD